MTFERDRDFFCWRILPAAFLDFMGRIWLLTSLIAYLSTSPKLDLELSELLHRVLLQGEEDAKEAREGFSEGPHLEI